MRHMACRCKVSRERERGWVSTRGEKVVRERGELYNCVAHFYCLYYRSSKGTFLQLQWWEYPFLTVTKILCTSWVCVCSALTANKVLHNFCKVLLFRWTCRYYFGQVKTHFATNRNEEMNFYWLMTSTKDTRTLGQESRTAKKMSSTNHCNEIAICFFM